MTVVPDVLGCALAFVVGRVTWMGSLLEGNKIGGVELWGQEEVWDALVTANADGPIMRDGSRSELVENT